jgi:hypothetical protein
MSIESTDAYFQQNINLCDKKSKKTKQKKQKESLIMGSLIMGPQSYTDTNVCNLARENRVSDALKKIQTKKDSSELRKTRMCKNLGCSYGTNCNYAHNIDELNIQNCAFGDDCKHVNVTNGIVTNNRVGKQCVFKHISETNEQCKIRTKIGEKPLTNYLQIKEKTEFEPIPLFPPPPPLFQNDVPPPPPQNDVPPPPPQNDVPPPPPQNDVLPFPPPPPQTPPQTPPARSQLKTNEIVLDTPQSEILLQVPRELALKALEMALNAGNVCIRLEITNM